MLFGKYLNKYYLKYGIFFIIGIVAMIFVDWYQLYIPEYLGEIVELLSNNDTIDIDINIVAPIIKGVIICAIVIFLGRIIWRLTLFNSSDQIEASLRKEMFLKAERLSQTYYHENKVGQIMAWFTSDIETIAEFLRWGTVLLVDATFLSIFVIIKMLRLDWVLSIIAFIPMILIIIWGTLVEKVMAQKWEYRQKEFDNLYDYSQESFTGIRVIKAFVKENNELHNFATIAKKNKDTNINFVKVSVIFDVIIEILIISILSILLGFGGWFVYASLTNNPIIIFKHTINLSAGHLITFLGYFDSLVWPMIALGQIISMRSRAKASLKRITDFLDKEEDIHDCYNPHQLDNVKGEIRFNHFNFGYPSTKNVVLNNIDITIKAGECVGIVGKIGSGKTTLVNSLLRLYNVEDNTIFIDGYDIMKCSIDSVRNAIAYVPQDNFLYSDKVKNNISFSNENMSDEEIKKAAAFAAVDDNIEDFKDKYDTVCGEKGVTLSGGQKQRISIARAYAKNSSIMILDDSVSAVDVKTEEVIINNIRSLRKGKTTIVIASRISTVKDLDRIVVLKDGQVEAFGTSEELLTSSPTYQKMFSLQQLEKELEEEN